MRSAQPCGSVPRLGPSVARPRWLGAGCAGRPSPGGQRREAELSIEIPPITAHAAIFVELPGDEGRQNLRPGQVVGVDGRELVVALPCPERERAQRVTAGQPLVVYFDHRHAWSQLSVRVERVGSDRDRVLLTLAQLGEPVAAESRQCYRASALSADIRAVLGGSPACTVLDVSATGFSVYAPALYEPGTSLLAMVVQGPQRVPGRVRVQNVRRTPAGRIRCGVQCDEGPDSLALLRELPRINAELQRRELARRSGLASEPSSAVARSCFVPRRALAAGRRDR